MGIIPWLIIACNILGVGIMLKWGLPKEIPFFGRDDGDPILGYLGLMLFVTSIAARVMMMVTS